MTYAYTYIYHQSNIIITIALLILAVVILT